MVGVVAKKLARLITEEMEESEEMEEGLKE